MALGLTQPQTEMSTSNIREGKALPVRKAKMVENVHFYSHQQFLVVYHNI
jgi:hypothetical protein